MRIKQPGRNSARLFVSDSERAIGPGFRARFSLTASLFGQGKPQQTDPLPLSILLIP